MTSLLSRLSGVLTRAQAASLAERKASRTAAVFHVGLPGLVRPHPRQPADIVRQGYERNPIVFRSVRMIAESVASIRWLAYEGESEAPDHPALGLVTTPNREQSGMAFLEALVSNLLLFGNAFVEAVRIDGAMREWHVLRPDRMSIVPGANGWPEFYEYRVGAERIRFSARDGSILHLKVFAPLDDHYGASPLAAAETALDIHNAAGAWNRALLENAARPSGALVYAGPEGATLSEEQFSRLKSELDESFSGFRNAGRPLLLEGGLDWKALSLSPKDMDFIEAKSTAAREIALALGVPPLLLGLPGDNTFANYQEANRAFWRQTVLPCAQRIQDAFRCWLAEDYGGFHLQLDLDRIDALASERAAEWARIGAADFLTREEKRSALGYGARS